MRATASGLGDLEPFTPEEVAALVSDACLCAQATILLGISEEAIPSRISLRRAGSMIRSAEEAAMDDDR